MTRPPSATLFLLTPTSVLERVLESTVGARVELPSTRGPILGRFGTRSGTRSGSRSGVDAGADSGSVDPALATRPYVRTCARFRRACGFGRAGVKAATPRRCFERSATRPRPERRMLHPKAAGGGTLRTSTMTVSPRRPMLATILRLPERCCTIASHTSRKVAPGDPGELRRCPKVAE